MLIGHIELTDTYAGEANYSWVKSEKFICDGLTDHQIHLKARKLVGITGMRCKKTDLGEMVVWEPYNANLIAFLTFTIEDDVDAEI